MNPYLALARQVGRADVRRFLAELAAWHIVSHSLWSAFIFAVAPVH